MEKQHHQHNGGFLFGVIVGVFITLLFSTKKGRKILKKLLDEGTEKFGDWEQMLKEAIEQEKGIEKESEDEGSDYLPEVTASSPEVLSHPEDERNEEPADVSEEVTIKSIETEHQERQGEAKEQAPSSESKEPHKTHRFFKRSNKK